MLFAALIAFVMVVQILALADSQQVFRTEPGQSGTRAILQSLEQDLPPVHCLAPTIPESAEEPLAC